MIKEGLQITGGLLLGDVIGYIVDYIGGSMLATILVKNTSFAGSLEYNNLVSLGVTAALAYFTRHSKFALVTVSAFAFQAFWCILAVLQSINVLGNIAGL